MHRLSLQRWLALAAALAAPAAAAQTAPVCGETAEVALTCRLTGDGARARLVASQAPARGGCAAVLSERFAAGDLERPRSLALAAGQTGECRFAGGRTLRVRVQEEPVPLAGPCIADPAVSVSLWLDGRKVVSRQPVHGRCEGAPATWAYRVEGDAVYDCRRGDPCAALTGPGRPLASLPTDAIEYPTGAPAPRPGSLQRLLDRGPVCAEAERRLAASWQAFDPYAPDDDSDGPIRRLAARAGREPARLPDGVQFAYGGASVQDFDFDNDGRIDRVYAGDSDAQGGWYYSPLLILAGASAERFVARAGADAIRAVPCQWDRAHPPLSRCDDVRGADGTPAATTTTQSVAAPQAGIEGGDEFFRTRYTTTLPLRFQGATYVALSGRGEPSRDYVALYRPGPAGAHEAVCLIRRVPANM